jgi:NAD(P)-dependent dehydrogenase (short-subunit alcohol dehydrogenase family)
MGPLGGRVAFITGGEGSIGMATARRLVADDAKVVLVGIEEEGLRAGVAELGADAACHVVADVADAAQVAAAVRVAVARHGGLDIVFSNAGISGVIAPVAEYPDDVFDRVLAVHVRRRGGPGGAIPRRGRQFVHHRQHGGGRRRHEHLTRRPARSP